METSLLKAKKAKPGLNLLGGLRVEGPSGDRVALSGRKGPALLAYLAMCPGRTSTRDRLADLFWGENDDEHARNSLRQTLSQLRREFATLGIEALQPTKTEISLCGEVDVDVLRFRQDACSRSLEECKRAADIYAGHFLDGVLSGSSSFDRWAALQRDMLTAEAIVLHEQLVGATSGEEAISYARKLVSLDPAREASHLIKIRLHVSLGQTELALKQYEVCRTILREELDVSPSAEIEEVRRALTMIAPRRSSPGEDFLNRQSRRGWIDPSKKSVVVLPFRNLSGDPEQEFFAEGITEDIIVELARFKTLFVVCKNTAFQFKGRDGVLPKIGEEIGADYVVEGSLRRSANRLRVTAQLVETASGRQIWSARFDRDANDIFAVQDEVVHSIAASIPGTVDRQLLETLRRARPESLAAYECELRGRWAFYHWSEGVDEAIKWFERAVEADPNYADALAWLARTLGYSTLVSGNPRDDARVRAEALIERAVTLDSRSPAVHGNAAGVYLARGKWELARKHALMAYELNPNDPATLNTMALVLTYTGSAEDAVEWHKRSESIEPYAADDQRLDILCDTYYLLGDYEKVIQIHQNYLNAPGGVKDVLAAAMAQAGRIEEAREVIDQMEKSGFTRSDSAKSIALQMLHCSRDQDRDRWLEGYRKAGLDV